MPSTRPKTKDWQDPLASHWAWHAAAVAMPVGWEMGVWLPLEVGALPQVLRALRGDPETEAMKAEAARMVVKVCMIAEDWDGRMVCRCLWIVDFEFEVDVEVEDCK